MILIIKGAEVRSLFLRIYIYLFVCGRALSDPNYPPPPLTIWCGRVLCLQYDILYSTYDNHPVHKEMLNFKALKWPGEQFYWGNKIRWNYLFILFKTRLDPGSGSVYFLRIWIRKIHTDPSRIRNQIINPFTFNDTVFFWWYFCGLEPEPWYLKALLSLSCHIS